MAATGAAVTYRELNDRSNQLAQCFFEAGLRFGDHIAVVMENRPEFFEVCWAAQRSGLYYTCINWHFNADETAYILDDCDAQVLVISDTFRAVATELVDRMPNVKLRLMVGDRSVDGYESYAETRDRYPAEPLEEELEGTRMLYSSGTTGRPKGVRYKIPRQRIGDLPAEMGMMTALWGMGLMMLAKTIVVVSEHVNVHDLSEVAWRATGNIDPKRDLVILEGPMDDLDHAALRHRFGGKLGVDATEKGPLDDITQAWPDEIRMSEEIRERVTRRWKDYGL